MSKKNLFSKPLKKQTMAEQMASNIKELILSGKLEAGDALPTEPELSESFGVSRAVVRDATRILMALGLVEVKHGLGVFVTETQNEAFGDALFLALRRAGATVWDVEQFEQIIFPEVIALAAVTATDEEMDEIHHLADEYINVTTAFHTKYWGVKDIPDDAKEGLMLPLRAIMLKIFAATRNQIFQQLAHPLLRLRTLRFWQGRPDETLEDVVRIEEAWLKQLLSAINSRDATQARTISSALMQLPAEAIEAMKQTPLGESAQIPLSISDHLDEGL